MSEAGERLVSAANEAKVLSDIARLRAALDDCVMWMRMREKHIPGVERFSDRGMQVLVDTHKYDLGRHWD